MAGIIGCLTAMMVAGYYLVVFVRWIMQQMDLCYGFGGANPWERGRVEFYQAMPPGDRRLWKQYLKLRLQCHDEIVKRLQELEDGTRPWPADLSRKAPPQFRLQAEVAREMGMGKWEALHEKYFDKAPHCAAPKWWWN
jgi:hypothetical protein